MCLQLCPCELVIFWGRLEGRGLWCCLWVGIVTEILVSEVGLGRIRAPQQPSGQTIREQTLNSFALANCFKYECQL